MNPGPDPVPVSGDEPPLPPHEADTAHFDVEQVARAVQQTFACPTQWVGELVDGSAFYFRYRSGTASLAVGPDAASVEGRSRLEDSTEAVTVAVVAHGGRFQGAFDSAGDRDEVFALLLAQVALRRAAGVDHAHEQRELRWLRRGMLRLLLATTFTGGFLAGVLFGAFRVPAVWTAPVCLAGAALISLMSVRDRDR